MLFGSNSLSHSPGIIKEQLLLNSESGVKQFQFSFNYCSSVTQVIISIINNVMSDVELLYTRSRLCFYGFSWPLLEMNGLSCLLPDLFSIIYPQQVLESEFMDVGVSGE